MRKKERKKELKEIEHFIYWQTDRQTDINSERFLLSLILYLTAYQSIWVI